MCPGAGIGKDGFPLEEAFSSRQRQVAPLLYVRQVMTTDVVCLHEEDTLRDALSLFLEKRVSGAPVIDSEGSLVGVLSMTDVIWVESKEAMDSLEFPFYPTLEEDSAAGIPERDEEECNSMLDKTDVLLNMKVASRMSRNIISIEPDVLINQAAALMIENSINRLPVVDPATRSAQNQGGMVLGIITRLDIMRCLAAVWL
jgi:CBS domain-containing protein